ncbi:MAG: flavin reductase family protein, partial [Nitrososphaerota archaeon]|nr:flavin reductase family protein [Nitrososphaerota archaeon]
SNLPRSALQLVKKQVAYRLFYPQVPVILCAKHGRSVAAMPANSCMPLSDSPTLVGVSVRNGSKTEKVLSKAPSFSLCWLGYSVESERIVNDLSSKAGSEADKLKTFGIPYKTIGGVPVLDDSEAFIVCRKMSSEEIGDHTLFVGIIQTARASSDFSEDEYWRFNSYKPMLYLGSNKKHLFATL